MMIKENCQICYKVAVKNPIRKKEIMQVALTEGEKRLLEKIVKRYAGIANYTLYNIAVGLMTPEKEITLQTHGMMTRRDCIAI